MHPHQIAGWIIGAAIVVVLIVAFYFDGERDIAIHRAQSAHQMWQTTPSGVGYYKECIEGHVFLVTHSSYNYKHLAGPLGECE